MASRTGKTLVLAVLGLVVAIAAVGCGSGGVDDADRTPAAPADGAQAPAPSSSVAPAAPATPGSALEPLTIPPERSLWALSPESYDEGLEIEVEFEPYGVDVGGRYTGTAVTSRHDDRIVLMLRDVTPAGDR